jgi:CrcB protein
VSLLLVMLGAAIGAPLRYLTDRAVQARFGTALPWGTLVVNVAGSFVLGLLTGGFTGDGAPRPVMLAVGVGFCGAFTTYSTFSFETLRLVERRSYRAAAINVLLSVLASVGAAFVGAAVSSSV